MTRSVALVIGVALIVFVGIYPGSSLASGYTVIPVQCNGTQVNVTGITPAATTSIEVVGQWVVSGSSTAYYAPVSSSGIGNCVSLNAFLGATWARAIGINDMNQIVGFYKDTSGQFHGFTYNPGPPAAFAPFNILGANTSPNAINDSDGLGGVVIVGSYLTSERFGFVVTAHYNGNAIVPDNDAVTGITDIAGTDTSINGVNTAYSGKTYFVGDSGYGQHGFWGTITVTGSSSSKSIAISPLTPFDCANATATKPFAVDNNGMMVGRTTIGGTTYGFTAPFSVWSASTSGNCNTSYPLQASKSRSAQTAFTGSDASNGYLVGISGNSVQNGVLLIPQP